MSNEAVAQDYRPAGVKAAAPWRIRSVEVLPGYCLSVTCNDGTTGIVDMSRLVTGNQAGIFAALKDEQLFSEVRLELGALTWPNGADMDPEWIHDEIARNNVWQVPA